mmetsp:Transcript_52227/g.144591  ORF Transcript_52227/g.144591 Transcript_52227/m.144591 type:complete len:201 (+) Transcript_52227:311-913(+)
MASGTCVTEAMGVSGCAVVGRGTGAPLGCPNGLSPALQSPPNLMLGLQLCGGTKPLGASHTVELQDAISSPSSFSSQDSDVHHDSEVHAVAEELPAPLPPKAKPSCGASTAPSRPRMAASRAIFNQACALDGLPTCVCASAMASKAQRGNGEWLGLQQCLPLPRAGSFGKLRAKIACVISSGSEPHSIICLSQYAASEKL